MSSRGVICGADAAQEWLLPWWWERYRAYNDLPVAFFDFGMTPEKKEWCRVRGQLISLPRDCSFVFPRSAVAQDDATAWEQRYYGQELWQVRKAWFQKPFALLNSPFAEAIWIDLDCEVLSPLHSLFSHCDEGKSLALVRETPDKPVIYNGGVILFQRGCKLIQEWAACAIDQNHLFLSDDRLLSHLIEKEQTHVYELDPVYNWTIGKGVNINVKIMHWMGAGGKEFIRNYGGIKPLLDAFYQSCQRQSS